MAFKEGYWWNNFTEDWMAQTVSNCVLNIYISKNKMPFQGTLLDNCIEDAMQSLHVQFACIIEPGASVIRKLT